jgi:hypothetical protein
MSLPKVKDFSDYDNYVTDPNYTTSAQAQEYFKNQGELLKAVILSSFWQPSTTYTKGAVVETPSMPKGTEAVCVSASGKSSTAEPEWGSVGGANIADGTVFWQLRVKNTGVDFNVVGETTNRGTTEPNYGLG